MYFKYEIVIVIILLLKMKGDDDFFSTDTESEFNMEFSYFNRLNYLLYGCNAAAISLDIYAWYHSLAALFRELSAEMPDKDKDEWQIELISINQLVSNHLNMAQRGLNRISPDLYVRLHNFELFLRKILKDAGLQHKKKMGAGQALM